MFAAGVRRLHLHMGENIFYQCYPDFVPIIYGIHAILDTHTLLLHPVDRMQTLQLMEDTS
jgi:hypothetical protein